MKNTVQFLVAVLVTCCLIPAAPAQVQMDPDSVSMGGGYVTEVYYQFSTGNKTEVDRASWDIAFRSMILSSCILTNDGSGVVLWTYPHADTSGWAAIDTAGLSGWPPMYNDPSDWENGAFSRHATSHPDYGWGKYNMATHVLTGDSLFVIQLRDGNFKKLWIVEKDSPQNIYSFRYANLDGSDYQEISLDCNGYLNKEFIGFNMQINLPVDFQPGKEQWDILFTKYMSVQPNGEPYPVTGVLSNPEVITKRFYPVPPDFNEWYPASWDSTRSNIGWDWKVFDMNNFVYIVRDSMVFYVKDLSGDTYRLKFTAFAGSSTGNINFGRAKVSSAGLWSTPQPDLGLLVFPNPATERIVLILKHEQTIQCPADITITDLSGRVMLRAVAQPESGEMPFGIASLVPGTYLVRVKTRQFISSGMFIKL